MQAKPDCFCDRCNTHVAAQKTTHHLRNSIAALALLPTLGISALMFQKEQWHCPTCGGSVRDLQELPPPSMALLIGILVVALIIVAILS